jgi:nitrous oxidase accessory protein NosD
MTCRFILATVVLTAAIVDPATVRAETIVVSPTGPHRSIARAVREAPAGSTIVVSPGVYREKPIVVDRPLTIVGDGRSVIEPVEAATLIRITADDVVLRGLVLANIVPSHVEDRAALKFERCAGAWSRTTRYATRHLASTSPNRPTAVLRAMSCAGAVRQGSRWGTRFISGARAR